MAQFWYSFGGKNREVTEAHIKQFNESQSKYRIEGTFQGDYFEALAKIRAAAATKTAPAVFHVIGEAIPQLAAAGLFENLEPYAKGANGANLEDYLPGQTQHTYFDYLGKPPAPLMALPFFRSHAHPLLQRRHARGQGREGADHVGRAARRGGQAHRARGQRDQDLRLRGAGGLVVLVRAAPRGRRVAAHARRQEGRLPRQGHRGARSSGSTS